MTYQTWQVMRPGSSRAGPRSSQQHCVHSNGNREQFSEARNTYTKPGQHCSCRWLLADWHLTTCSYNVIPGQYSSKPTIMGSYWPGIHPILAQYWPIVAHFLVSNQGVSTAMSTKSLQGRGQVLGHSRGCQHTCIHKWQGHCNALSN